MYRFTGIGYSVKKYKMPNQSPERMELAKNQSQFAFVAGFPENVLLN